MPTAIFRVNASASIGLGHLMRCLALAQAFQKQQFESVFLVNEAALAICRSRKDWVGKTVVVPSNISLDQELSFIAKWCNAENSNVIVLDGYQFDEHYRELLKTLSNPVVCFDDSGLDSQRAPECLHADVIINGAADAINIDYQQTNPGSQVCAGDKFRVLRGEFVDITTTAIENRGRVTISMGGSDPADLSRPLLQALKGIQFDEELTLVTGAAYPHLEWLEDLKQHGNLNFTHIHDCQNIAQIFAETRWAISAAGGSQFELQSCGTPACLLVVAENQLGATNSATQQGWCLSLDCRNAQTKFQKTQIASKVVAQMLDMLNNPIKLQKMSDKALLTADTSGAQRIVSCIKEVTYD